MLFSEVEWFALAVILWTHQPQILCLKNVEWYAYVDMSAVHTLKTCPELYKEQSGDSS